MAKKKNAKKRKHGGNRHKNHHTNDDDVNYSSNQDNVKCSQSLTSDINIAASEPMPNTNELPESNVVNVSIDANELWIDSMFDHHQQHLSQLTVPDVENRDSYAKFLEDLIDAESNNLYGNYLKIYNVQCSPTHQQSASFCNQLLYRHLISNNHHHSANDISLMTDLLDYDNSDTISVEEDCNFLASNTDSDFFNSNVDPMGPNSLILNALNNCPIDQNYGNTEQKNLFSMPQAISDVTPVNPSVTNNSHSNSSNIMHDHSYSNYCHHRQPTLNDVENDLRSMLIEAGADLNLLDMYDMLDNSDRGPLAIPSFEEGDSRRLDDYFEDYETEIYKQKLFLMDKNRRAESEDNILFYSARVRRPLYEKPPVPVPLPMPTQEPLIRKVVQPEMKKDNIDDPTPTTSGGNNKKKKRKKKKNKQNQSNKIENGSMGHDPPDKKSTQKTMLSNSEMSYPTTPKRGVKPFTTNHSDPMAAKTDYDDEDDYAGDVDEDSKDLSQSHYPADKKDEQHLIWRHLFLKQRNFPVIISPTIIG